MSTWDEDIFTTDHNVDFLEEMANLDEEGVIRAVEDACEVAHSKPKLSGEEEQNAQAAATIAAIWAGAPFSAGDVVEDYPYIRELVGSGSETLTENALEVLENVEEEYDLEAFIEALS
ncbi:DUF4259 domain-containing protein [Corynebacterium tuberculostearicum]|uniref:DUF4259 domain-containing protein n=1 Tax=Corynebacterium tuberculostearicum TaxID=38304 RepID=A0AAE4NN00_9CORY|nr:MULTISPECIES: DUF4259 domain-containing protein [Corynebacterium]MCT1426931.1 DUF4259 domain-containing protein [Corynebacterium sp. p3-SID1241]MDV2419729.1 DUF4259 domain-containing protein [Corynebacterium tuberculostearicum]